MEVTRASRQKSWEGSQHYKLLAKLEAEVASEADHVFCITNALANEMERRGLIGIKFQYYQMGSIQHSSNR